jgi:hypothetical protein
MVNVVKNGESDWMAMHTKQKSSSDNLTACIINLVTILYSALLAPLSTTIYH